MEGGMIQGCAWMCESGQEGGIFMKNWTVNALESLQKAQSRAYELQHAELEPLHLLGALLGETGLATNTLRSMELDPGLIARTVDKELQSLPKIQRKDLPGPSRELQQLFLEAENLAKKNQGGMVGTRELLLALAADQGRAGSVLQAFDITPQKIARALEVSGRDQAYEGDDEAGVADGRRGQSTTTRGESRP